MSNTPAAKGTVLVKKLVEVSKAIGTITKSGYNKHQNYHYTTEADLIEAVKTQLLSRNVFIFTTSKVTGTERLISKDKEGNDKTTLVTTVECIHTLVDGDSGESYSVASVGTGADNMDKGLYKALTGSYKYFLSKNFMIASEDDPENDGVTKPAAKTTGGSLFGGKKTEPKKEVTAPTTEVKAEAAPEAAPVVTPEPPKVEAATPPATPAALMNTGAKTLTVQRKPVFNNNKAANASVKF